MVLLVWYILTVCYIITIACTVSRKQTRFHWQMKKYRWDTTDHANSRKVHMQYNANSSSRTLMTLCMVLVLTKPCTLMNLYVKFSTVNQCMLTMFIDLSLPPSCITQHKPSTSHLIFQNNNNPPWSITVVCVRYQLSSFWLTKMSYLCFLWAKNALSIRHVHPQ